MYLGGGRRLTASDTMSGIGDIVRGEISSMLECD